GGECPEARAPRPAGPRLPGCPAARRALLSLRRGRRVDGRGGQRHPRATRAARLRRGRPTVVEHREATDLGPRPPTPAPEAPPARAGSPSRQVVRRASGTAAPRAAGVELGAEPSLGATGGPGVDSLQGSGAPGSRPRGRRPAGAPRGSPGPRPGARSGPAG